MKLRALKYLPIYTAPAIVLLSLSASDHWTFFALIFLFVVVPLVELFLKGSTENLSKVEEEIAKKDKLYDYLLYGLVPMQYLIVGYFLMRVSLEGIPFYAKVGMTTALGISCGVLGINAAHELGHRLTRFERNMSKMLLLTSLYMHFYIEHNRGHHKHVSTDDDPASSRYGEILYTFYFRTIWGSWMSAWNLEAQRLAKTSHSFWSLHNEMLRFQLFQLAFVALIFFLFGWETALFFMVGATMGFLLLETVNYIEHYGLRRKEKANGKYERVLPTHSWNSNHPMGRLLLLELSRHSDHHYMASRKYQLLRHFDESPQMPTGYPGMMILAFFPPLWFRVMHPLIERQRVVEVAE